MPISLLITLEMVKLFQAVVIYYDEDMVTIVSDEKGKKTEIPAKV